MIKLALMAILLPLNLASCEDVAYPVKFTVKVVDALDNPVRNIKVGTSTFVRWEPGQGFGKDIWEGPERQNTNAKGEVTFSYRSKSGEVGIGVSETPKFYRSNWPNYKFEEVVNGRWKPENPTIIYRLKEKRNPIPLYAKTYYINPTAVPKINADCGYDLEKGDWVRPHGEGAIADIVFNLQVRRDKGVYDNDCTLTVSFSNKGDGLISSPKPLNEGSELRLDYLAPKKGYQPMLSMRAFTDPADQVRHEGFERTQNYFLRVRTELDRNGKTVRANYAKVHGDFEFWYTGEIRFTYYFNPTENDRNLEFNPERNLFPDLDSLEMVNTP